MVCDSPEACDRAGADSISAPALTSNPRAGFRSRAKTLQRFEFDPICNAGAPRIETFVSRERGGSVPVVARPTSGEQLRGRREG